MATASPASLVAPEAPTRAVPRAGRALRVLVVDPVAFVGEQVARLLATHEVLAVTSASEALSVIGRNEPIDAILYAQTPRGLPGLAFAEVLATQYPELLPRLVLLLSRAPSWEALRLIADAGQRWIAKPLRYVELVTVIDLAARRVPASA